MKNNINDNGILKNINDDNENNKIKFDIVSFLIGVILSLIIILISFINHSINGVD